MSESDPPGPNTNETAPMSRRRLLVSAGAAIVLAGCGGSDPTAENVAPSSGRPSSSTIGQGPSGSTPVSTAPVTVRPAACVLTPELTAGPYYLDGHLARVDITEGRPGTPLEFRVRVLALPDCTPLEGAAVDIWHCDAGGEYSGFNGNSLEATQAGGTNDKRFLRGVQLTDADGVATFTTIFPGWYEGRTVHIHLKVLDGGTLANTYTSGHVAHVGQAFFDEAITAEVLASGAYLAHTGNRTTNDQDSLYAQAGSDAIAELTLRAAGGYTGKFTCIVDPDATPPAAPLL